ncbi:MAG: hypothetical protein ABIK09_06425 [Pseudomonadota bacterium]
MFTKCPICGERLFTLFRKPPTCPKCGGELGGSGGKVARKKGETFAFPQRTSDSVMDELRRQAQGSGEFGGGRGTLTIFGNWSRFLRDRPLDIPFYTAVNGRATIAVLVSEDNVPDTDDLKRAMEIIPGVSIQLSAFLKGRYPLVRASFILPDNPLNPMILESPLNIADGDIQDFAAAAMADEGVDFALCHQGFPEGDAMVIGCQGVGLSAEVRRAFEQAGEAYNPGLTQSDFKASQRLLEEIYPSANAGVNLDQAILLKFAGDPVNRIIKYKG